MPRPWSNPGYRRHRHPCLRRPSPPACRGSRAAWGYRTAKNKSLRADTGKKELFFSYGANVISDAHYGLPLYLNVRPDNVNEGPRFQADLDAALKLYPWLDPCCLTADKGYHVGYNFQRLEDPGITPVIAIPKPRNGQKT